jgi:hypothetical protein
MVKVGDSRAARQQATQDRREQMSKGKRGYWSMRLKLTSVSTKLHLQRPEKPYKDVDSDTLYWWKRGRGHFIKSAQFPNGRFVECIPEQCLVCAHSNPGQFGFKANADAALTKFESKPYYAVSGWIEHNFHMVEKKKDKQVQKGEKDTYTVRERCRGRNCEYCKKDLPKVFGNRFFYDFSAAAWRDAMLPIIEKVERFAKDGGYIYPVNYVCEKCNRELFDMTKKCFECKKDNVGVKPETHMAVCGDCDAEWSLLEYEDENLMELASNPQACPNKKCKHQGYPKPVFAHSEGLEEWESYDIYDVQFSIKKTGKDKQSQTAVTEWKIQEPDARLFDPTYQGDEQSEAAQAIAKRHAECLDLDKIHSADIPAAQASMLNVANLFAGEGGRASQKQFKKFGKKGKGSKDEDEEDKEEEEEESEDDSDDDDSSDDE